jgi:ADP-ribose pyrophosphatase YjhB (NUDIX family)
VARAKQLETAVDHARHIIVAVGAVILNEAGEILLVKHLPEREGFWQGKWICPGGKLELGEPIADGILREVAEETAIDIELTEPVPPFERIHRVDGRLAFHVIYIDYIARVKGKPIPRCGDDVGEAEWFGPEKLARVWDEVHPDTRTLLALAKTLPSDLMK